MLLGYLSYIVCLYIRTIYFFNIRSLLDVCMKKHNKVMILNGASKSIKENSAILVGMGLFVLLNYCGQRFLHL